MNEVELSKGIDTPLKLEIEMKRDGSVKMIFPSLDDTTLMQLVQSIPQLQGDYTKGRNGNGAEELRKKVPRIFNDRSRHLESRMSQIENKMSDLVSITEEIMNSINPNSPKNGEEVRVPSNGTKYNEVLRRLTLEHGGGSFESTCVPEKERHILSILNNRYNALEVIDNRGRTNIYRVKEAIINQIFSQEGECINVEIRGKNRDVVERILKSNKNNYPKFSYFLKEGADQRQLYTLIFGDPSVKVSVMENLSRSVGNHRNMKIYSS